MDHRSLRLSMAGLASWATVQCTRNAMPLSAFFEDQIEELRAFLEAPDRIILVVQVDPEFRAILLKMLTGLDEQDDFPHVLIGHSEQFAEPRQWFGALQDALEAEIERHAADLAAEGIQCANPARDPAARGPWPFLLRCE